MTIFHLVTESDWKACTRDGQYTPRRFDADGFVHCVGDRETAARIVAAYFSTVTEPVLLVHLDETKLDARLEWEAPAPPDGKAHAHHEGGARFPHVYGPLPLSAVTKVEPWS